MFDLPDLSTLQLCSFLASAGYAVVFATMSGGRRQPWMLWWSAASGTYSFVLLIYAAVGYPLPMWLAPAVNALLVLSTAFILAGVRWFDGKPPFARWMWTLVGAVALVPMAATLFPGGIAAMAGRILLSIGLSVSMLAFGWPLATSDADDGTRGVRRIAGWALFAYVPCYAMGIAAEFASSRTVLYIAVLPMLADQLLLSFANLSLLAIPGTRSQRQLRDAALRDPLTGAWNRAALAASEPALLVPGRIVLLVDVDHFKAINDSHGHATGDRVLQAIATGLQRAVAGDFVCRLGGDEFLAVTTAADAAAVAERVRARAGIAVAGLPPWSVSVGFAAIAPDDATLAEVVQRADRAMYRAKAEGRGRIAA